MIEFTQQELLVIEMSINDSIDFIEDELAGYDKYFEEYEGYDTTADINFLIEEHADLCEIHDRVSVTLDEYEEELQLWDDEWTVFDADQLGMLNDLWETIDA